MKRAIVAVLCCLAAGCAGMILGTQYRYDVSLAEGGLRFTDEMIDVTFTPGHATIGLELTNKSDQTIRILWDETVIIQEGRSKAVFHAGVKYAERDRPMPPSIVPKGARHEDLVMPKENVYYESGKYGGWKEEDMLPQFDKNEDDRKRYILAQKGASIVLFMPLEIGGVRKEYTFTFKVNAVEPVG